MRIDSSEWPPYSRQYEGDRPSSRGHGARSVCRRQMGLSMGMTVVVALAILSSLLLGSAAGADMDAERFARGEAIHKRAIVIDGHVDIPPDFGTEAYDPLAAKAPRQKLDLPGMEQGGLDAAFFVVYVPQRERNPAGYARAMADAFTKFAAIRRMTDLQHPDRIGLALTASDVRRLHNEGRRAALIGIENGYAIGRDLALLDIYYGLGARYLGLTHNGHNDIGDSAVPGSRRCGARGRARRPERIRAQCHRTGQRARHDRGHLPHVHVHRARRHCCVPRAGDRVPLCGWRGSGSSAQSLRRGADGAAGQRWRGARGRLRLVSARDARGEADSAGRAAGGDGPGGCGGLGGPR